MANTYKMTIAGLERELPLCPLNEHLDIAGFIMFGDAPLTVAAATELLKKAPEFDILLAPEAKGIPLAHEMARQSGKPYVVARKYPKLYMTNPLSVEVKSITTDKVQTLYISDTEQQAIQGARVLLVDDVISTGESLNAIEQLATTAGGIVCGRCAVLAEGDAAKRDDIFFLEPLPLFFK